MIQQSNASKPFKAAQMLLAFHDGLFIGEPHDISMGADFLITHMAEFRAMGVTTLYMEEDHQLLATRSLSEDCRNEYAGEMDMSITNAPSMYGERPNGYYEVIEEARKHGIRVIGADRRYATAETQQAWIQVNEEGRKEWTDLADEHSFSPEALRDRDIYAAGVVLATRDEGKFIVYGGNSHSRQSGAMPDLPSAGVNAMLGIPSIDFTDDKYFDVYRGNGELASLRTVANLIFGGGGKGLNERSLIKHEESGRATYLVTTKSAFGGDDTRYAERDRSLTDNRGDTKYRDPHMTDEIGTQMRAAGVCDDTQPECTYFRDLEDISELKHMVDAQYPPKPPAGKPR